MADRLLCPGCDFYGSGVLYAVRNGEPCPNCGLSADAICKVNEVREGRGHEALRTELADALLRVDKAEAAARKADVLAYDLRAALARYEGRD